MTLEQHKQAVADTYNDMCTNDTTETRDAYWQADIAYGTAQVRVITGRCIHCGTLGDYHGEQA